MQRLKRTFYGVETGDDKYKNDCNIGTCKIVSIAFFIALLIAFILVIATAGGTFVVLFPFQIYMLVMICLMRGSMREKYNIPGQLCGDSPLDDCCYSYWCMPCTLLQLVRHTHDEKVYQYEFGSETGLPEDAPEVV